MNGIYEVPADPAIRVAISREAGDVVGAGAGGTAPDRTALERLGRVVLARLNLPEGYLGWTMVACGNAVWREAFAAVPATRRLLLLPHCLRSSNRCRAGTDANGLHCAACGACDIAGLTRRAAALGYRVSVAEGASAVADGIIANACDAVLGVACLESLDRAFARVAAIGLPHLAVPLLAAGCVNTTADRDELMAWLEVSRPAVPAARRSFLPLLRAAADLGTGAELDELLPPASPDKPAQAIEAISRDWLSAGGKRLRAFCVLAAFAARRHGEAAFRNDTDTGALLPPPVRRLALAIEVMHKASLAHDDVQDDAVVRYGRPALHRVHGVAQAINVGDHLLGAGYGMVASLSRELGAETCADILEAIATAHRELCLGQGAELAMRSRWHDARTLDVLDYAARKTAPAFSAALYTGLRAAGPVSCGAEIARFARHLGMCFQVLDDLDDWPVQDAEAGADLRAGQPTVLAALAAEAGRGADLRRIADAGGAELVPAARALLAECGAFESARTLAARLRERALTSIDAIPGRPVQELLRFLVAVATEGR